VLGRYTQLVRLYIQKAKALAPPAVMRCRAIRSSGPAFMLAGHHLLVGVFDGGGDVRHFHRVYYTNHIRSEEEFLAAVSARSGRLCAPHLAFFSVRFGAARCVCARLEFSVMDARTALGRGHAGIVVVLLLLWYTGLSAVERR